MDHHRFCSIVAPRFNLSSAISSVRSSAVPSPTYSSFDLAASCSSASGDCFPSTPSRVRAIDVQLQPLIPGLPDDLAFACLLWLPLANQAAGRAVCRTWHRVLSDDSYFHARRSMGREEPWLLVLAFHKVTGKIQWQAMNPAQNSWHVIASMPCKERVCPPGFGCVANLEEGALFVCGGMRLDMDCPMDSVLKYELFKNRWTDMRPMSIPRSFFASGMIDGRTYAAGGNCTASGIIYGRSYVAGGNNTQSFISSAEVYDAVDDKWCPVASMGISMGYYDSAVLNGKLYVTEGWSWPFLSFPRGQIYDPKQDRWESMTVGMREGWVGLSVVLDGQLYIISEHDKLKLKVYDTKTDSWMNVGGSPIPSCMILPLSVNTINGKLLVVARSLHIALGTVSHSMNNEGNPGFSVQWQAICPPEKFSDFVPSHSLVLFA
eukprot:c21388_g2_i1 orf=403-1701(-)